MAHINWYPGHIAKAERKLKEQLSFIDVVVEVLDARLPLSSIYPNIGNLLAETPRLIILNKSDLADKNTVIFWENYLKNKFNFPVISVYPEKNNYAQIIKVIETLGAAKIEKLVKKGLLPRAIRVMVVGMPNVGKSTIINRLIKKSKTKTGAKAGVTKTQQWVRINPKIDLLDTPGIIPMKLDNQLAAQKLAFVSSVSENAYDKEEVAISLLEMLVKKYKKELYSYYNLNSEENATLENIAIARNWLVKNSQPDIERTATYLLKDFRDGKIGQFTLDTIDE